MKQPQKPNSLLQVGAAVKYRLVVMLPIVLRNPNEGGYEQLKHA